MDNINGTKRWDFAVYLEMFLGDMAHLQLQAVQDAEFVFSKQIVWWTPWSRLCAPDWSGVGCWRVVCSLSKLSSSRCSHYGPPCIAALVVLGQFYVFFPGCWTIDATSCQNQVHVQLLQNGHRSTSTA